MIAALQAQTAQKVQKLLGRYGSVSKMLDHTRPDSLILQRRRTQALISEALWHHFHFHAF
jgi:hypothetical protein